MQSTVHVKRDAAGAVKRRDKRIGGGVQSRKRAPNVLDNDLGIAVDSGDETDLAEGFGLSEAIPAPSIAAPPAALEDETVEEEEMSLGAQGDAFWAAINASLGAKIDGVAVQVTGVASRVEIVERQVVATNRTVETQGAQLNALDLGLTSLERGRPAATPGGDSGFCGGPDTWRQFGRVAATNAAAGSAASSGGRPESVASGGGASAFSATDEENDLGRVMAEQFRLPIERR